MMANLIFIFFSMSKSKKDTSGYSWLTKSSFMELKKDGRIKHRARYYDRVENIRDPKWNHIDPFFMIREDDGIPK